MKILTANDATQIVKEFKNNGLTYIRKNILEIIENNAKNGKTEVIIDNSYPFGIYLKEDDYTFFENLGYKVIREETKYYTPHGVPYSSKHTHVMKISAKILWSAEK